MSTGLPPKKARQSSVIQLDRRENQVLVLSSTQGPSRVPPESVTRDTMSYCPTNNTSVIENTVLPIPENINDRPTHFAVSEPDTSSMRGGLSVENSDPINFSYESISSVSNFDSLFNVSEGLGWDDLFDPTADFTFPLPSLSCTQHLGDSTQIPYACEPRTEQPHPGIDSRQRGISQEQGTFTKDASSEVDPPPYTVREFNESDLFEHAETFLKHFRDSVIPQFSPLIEVRKSPWEVQNWSNAVQTHADLTYLQSSDVGHARKANFFAVIGCSACNFTKTNRSSLAISYDECTRIAEHASATAKLHMQKSLQEETSGIRKAKYKDQLMALFSLIALAVRTQDLFTLRKLTIDRH